MFEEFRAQFFHPHLLHLQAGVLHFGAFVVRVPAGPRLRLRADEVFGQLADRGWPHVLGQVAAARTQHPSSSSSNIILVIRERGFGQIINVSSVGVQTRALRFGAYIASKAALNSLCDALQAEVVNDNVKFTTVHMALVRTPMISTTTMYDKFPALTHDQAAGGSPTRSCTGRGGLVHRSVNSPPSPIPSTPR